MPVYRLGYIHLLKIKNMKLLKITIAFVLLMSLYAFSSCAKKGGHAPGKGKGHNCDQQQESSKSST